MASRSPRASAASRGSATGGVRKSASDNWTSDARILPSELQSGHELGAEGDVRVAAAAEDLRGESETRAAEDAEVLLERPAREHADARVDAIVVGHEPVASRDGFGEEHRDTQIGVEPRRF